MMTNKFCFLLGGGPTLRDFDFSLLEGHITIGVNKIFKLYDPTILYCMDRKFFAYIHSNEKIEGDENLLDLWLNSKAKKYFIASNSKDKNTSTFFKNEPIEIVPRLQTKCISMDLKKGIFPSNNSGFGALMLAIALGYKTVYLLGYDMRIDEQHTHCHNGYPNQKMDNQQRHLESFKRSFYSFARDIEKAGIEVINLSPNSALDCFKKKNIKDVFSKLEKK